MQNSECGANSVCCQSVITFRMRLLMSKPVWRLQVLTWFFVQPTCIATWYTGPFQWCVCVRKRDGIFMIVFHIASVYVFVLFVGQCSTSTALMMLLSFYANLMVFVFKIQTFGKIDYDKCFIHYAFGLCSQFSSFYSIFLSDLYWKWTTLQQQKSISSFSSRKIAIFLHK